MKLYVVTRADLSKSQQAVQAGHAVAAWCLAHGHRGLWGNGTLVYLVVRSKELLEELYLLSAAHKALFKEPYWNNELTAVAVLDQIGKYDALKLL